MSKRPISAENPVVKSSQPFTTPVGSVVNLDPPSKVPKLVSSPPTVPEDETIAKANRDPQNPEVSVSESVNNAKENEHRDKTKEDIVTSSSQETVKVPEGEKKNPEVPILKNSAKRPSWASSYLTSIGVSYHKPIKINIPSMKNANVTAVKLSQATNTAEEKKTENKINESQLPSHSAITVNDIPVLTSIQNCSPELQTHNEDDLVPESNFNDEENLFIPKTNLLHCFHDIHPETLQIANENLPYLNYCSRRYLAEQPFYEEPSFTDNTCKNISYHSPAEDKSYLDKVNQFLAKLSKDEDEIEPHRAINAKIRSVSPNGHHIEKDFKYIENQNEVKMKAFRYNKVKLADEEYLKIPNRLIDSESNKKPSTSKRNYYNCKEERYEGVPKYRTKNVKLEDEYKPRDKYNLSRAEYRTRSPSHIHRCKEIGIQTSQSNSSSSSDHGGSPVHKKHENIMRNEKVISDSNNRSENYLESVQPSQYKKLETRRSRERSSSSSHKNLSRPACRESHNDKYKLHTRNMQRSNSTCSCHSEKCSSQKSLDRSACQISHDNKYKTCTKNIQRSNSTSSCQSKKYSSQKKIDQSAQISHENKCETYTRNRQRSTSKSSSHSEKLQDRSPRLTQRSQQRKGRTIKRRKNNSNSDSSSCRDRKDNKRYKIKRGSSSSSNDSDSSQDTSLCRAHKSYSNKKYITKRESKEKCVSKVRSENIRDRPNHNTEKCHESKIREKCNKSCASKNRKYSLSPDTKKTYKLIKDIISKDKVKKKLIKSLISYKSSKKSNANDKESKTSLASNTRLKIEVPNPPEKYSTKKHNADKEKKLSNFAPIKSAVHVKDNNLQKRRDHVYEIETDNFDLRSKLSRKNISQYISKIHKENNNTLEKEVNARESLVITKEETNNQDQDKTDSNNLIGQKETDNLKAKKIKKIKLVINVICENSDDDDTVKESRKESIDVDANVDKECTLSTEELSFLDDLNIDDIVDSLTHIKNEPGSSKNRADATVENKMLVDLCELISSTEDSDASTVHLEELCEMHDNFIDANNIIKGDDSSKSSNITFQNKRNAVLDRLEKSDAENFAQTPVTINTDDITPVKIEAVNQDTLVSVSDIKPEIVNIDINYSNKQKSKTEITSHAINAVPAKLKTKEDVYAKNVISNVNEIKKKVTNTGLSKKIKEKINEETDTKLLFTNKRKETSVMNDNYRRNRIIPLIEIKDEPIDLTCDYELKQAPNNIIFETEIKEKPEDKLRNPNITTENKIKSTACKLASENRIKDSKGMDNIIAVIELKDEPIDEMESKTIKPQENKNEHCIEELVSVNEILKIEIIDEDANKCSSNTPLPKTIKNKVSCPRDGNKKIGVNRPVVKIEEEHMDKLQSVEIKTSENSEHKLVLTNDIKSEVPDEDVNKRLSNTTLTQTVINNNIPHPKDKNEEIMKQFLKQNRNVGKTTKGIDNKITDNFDIVQSNPIGDSEKHVKNPQNISITKLNETFNKNSGNKSDTVKQVDNNKDLVKMSCKADNSPTVTIENKSNESSITASNKAVTNACCSENSNSINLNNTDSQIPNFKPEKILDNNLSDKITIKSTTEVSNNIENNKNLQVPRKNTEKVQEKNSLEIETNKKLDDKVSVNSMRDNSQNVNTKAVNDPKSDKKKGALTNNQESKDIKKTNIVADVKRVNKSHSLSPISSKTRQAVMKAEKTLEIKGKTIVKNLEDRLSQHLKETFTVTSLLHKGKFSKIFQCKNYRGNNYVVKMLSYESDGVTHQRFLDSLHVNMPKENLNFVHVITGLAVTGQWCLLMDFYPKNLSECLAESGRSFHVNHVQHLSRQLVAAVTILKHKNVIHSDIKPGHVLLNSTNDRLKLCGFDSAYHIGQVNLLPNIGSVSYRAPEIILGHSAGFSIDVWSTALVMFEMASTRRLFPGYFNNDILFKQICTLGYIPIEMINSRFGQNHFEGLLFKRRSVGLPYSAPCTTLLSENQIYRNKVLRSTVTSTYYREWAKDISTNQKSEELSKIHIFCNLLEKMLAIHPKNRLSIEYVCASPYIRGSH